MTPTTWTREVDGVTVNLTRSLDDEGHGWVWDVHAVEGSDETLLTDDSLDHEPTDNLIHKLLVDNGVLDGTVNYLVPVVVTIEGGKVVAVNVCDESAKLWPGENEKEGVLAGTIAIAEAGEWPGWEFGF